VKTSVEVRRVRLQGGRQTHRYRQIHTDGHADVRTDRSSLRSKVNDGVEGEIINMYKDRRRAGKRRGRR